MTKTKDLFGNEREDYNPKELSFYNGLHTVENVDTKEQYSFFDYLWNRLTTKHD